MIGFTDCLRMWNYKIRLPKAIAYAGVWMYGGVPDISQKTISYQGYGDNIFLDVSRSHILPRGRISISYHKLLE